MTKTPIPTENSKTKGQHTQTPPKTSITQQLRTDLGRSVGVTSNPTGMVKPVYGIPTLNIVQTDEAGNMVSAICTPYNKIEHSPRIRHTRDGQREGSLRKKIVKYGTRF